MTTGNDNNSVKAAEAKVVFTRWRYSLAIKSLYIQKAVCISDLVGIKEVGGVIKKRNKNQKLLSDDHGTFKVIAWIYSLRLASHDSPVNIKIRKSEDDVFL